MIPRAAEACGQKTTLMFQRSRNGWKWREAWRPKAEPTSKTPCSTELPQRCIRRASPLTVVGEALLSLPYCWRKEGRKEADKPDEFFCRRRTKTLNKKCPLNWWAEIGAEWAGPNWSLGPLLCGPITFEAHYFIWLQEAPIIIIIIIFGKCRGKIKEAPWKSNLPKCPISSYV